MWTWFTRYQNVYILEFIGAKDDGGSGGDNWSYKLCKAPVNLSPPTNQHPVYFTCQMPFLSDSVRALNEKASHSMDFITASSKTRSSTLSLTTKGWLPWGGLTSLTSALWRQYTKVTVTDVLLTAAFLKKSIKADVKKLLLK